MNHLAALLPDLYQFILRSGYRIVAEGCHPFNPFPDMENTETQVWLEFSSACQYLPEEVYSTMLNDSQEIGKMIDHMINNPEKFTRNH